MRVVLGSHPSSSADLPLLPGETDGCTCRLGIRHTHRIHGQPPLRSARPPYAVRHRSGRTGRRPPGAAHDQHGGMRRRATRTRYAHGSRVRSRRRRLASVLPPGSGAGSPCSPADGRDRTGPDPIPYPSPCDSGQVRGQSRHQRCRHVRHRTPHDGQSDRPHHRGLRARRGRRRADDGRHRRTVDLPRCRPPGRIRRGRHQRTRIRARPAPHLVQWRARNPRAPAAR